MLIAVTISEGTWVANLAGIARYASARFLRPSDGCGLLQGIPATVTPYRSRNDQTHYFRSLRIDNDIGQDDMAQFEGVFERN